MFGYVNLFKVIFFVLGVNFVIFVFKLVVVLVIGLGVMLVEVVYLLVDCGN